MIEPIEPKTYDEAVSVFFEEHCKQAIQVELDDNRVNAFWKIVKYTGDMKPLDSVWVFKIKRDSNNKIVIFKA